MHSISEQDNTNESNVQGETCEESNNKEENTERESAEEDNRILYYGFTASKKYLIKDIDNNMK